MKTQHSPISPSNFERRLLCPGSLMAEKDLPDSISIYSQEGTMLHDRVNKFVCNKVFEKGLSEDQKDAVIRAGVYFVSLTTIDMNENIVLAEEHEKTFKLDFIRPEMTGTVDSILITYNMASQEYNLHIIDYKFGKGIAVSAHNNYQLLLYYIGAINDAKIKEILSNDKYNVHLHIVQPYKTSSVWSLTEEEKLYYNNLELYQDVVIKCYAPNAPRIPNKKACQFCKAKAICPELASCIPNINLNIKMLSDEQIAQTYENKDLIIMYLKSIEQYIKDKLQEGEFLDYTSQPKLSNRKWSKEAHDTLISILGPNALETTSKLITITKAEKLIEKEIIDKLTYREEYDIEIIKINKVSSKIFKNLNND